jgi:glycosyltransferase involved in cell wall biosynthesis
VTAVSEAPHTADQLGQAPGDAPAAPVRGQVLCISYYFPPVGGVGVQRVLKYVTYLPRWGWRPMVVAPGNPGYGLRDASLMAAVPSELEVHRTRSLEPAKLPGAVRGLFRRLRHPRRVATAAVASDVTAVPTGRSLPARIAHKLASAWRGFWAAVLYPDSAVAWLPFGVLAAWRAHRRQHVDVVYSSALPISTHQIGRCVAWLTKRPWVADFRDPWVGNPLGRPTRRVTAWLQRRTERGIVRRADRVVFATAALREMYAARYPDLGSKFVFIPNGYDLADLAGLRPAPYEPGRFHLLFAGSLYRSEELTVFLAGLERLVARRPDIRDRLRVHFLGRVSDANRRVAEEFSAPARLGGVISFETFVPRPEALSRIAGADALLQLMPSTPGAEIFVGGKLLEYLAFDKPILGVMPGGEGRRLIDGLPAGRSADVDPDSVADALEKLVDDPPQPGPNDPSGRYDRLNLAGELANLLDEVAAERTAERAARQARGPAGRE